MDNHTRRKTEDMDLRYAIEVHDYIEKPQIDECFYNIGQIRVVGKE